MEDVTKKCTGGCWSLSYDAVTQTWEVTRQGILGVFATVRRKEGQSTIEAEANARCIANANSMATALQAIADMQIKPDSNKEEILALCITIAKIEIAKLER